MEHKLNGNEKADNNNFCNIDGCGVGSCVESNSCLEHSGLSRSNIILIMLSNDSIMAVVQSALI